MNSRADKYPFWESITPAMQTMNTPSAITRPLSITQGYGIKRNCTEETPLDLSTKKMCLSGSVDISRVPAPDVQPEHHRGLIYDRSKDRYLSMSSFSETHLEAPLLPRAPSGNSYLRHQLLTDRNTSISPYVTGPLYPEGASDNKPIHSSPETVLKPPAHSVLTAQYYMAGRVEGNYIHHTTTQTSFMGTGVVEQEMPPLYSVLTGKVVSSGSGPGVSYNPPYMADLNRPNSHHSETPMPGESSRSNKNALFYQLPHGNDTGQSRILSKEQPGGLAAPRDANILYPYAPVSKPNTVVTHVNTASRYDPLLRSPSLYPSTVSQQTLSQPPGFLPQPMATPIRYNPISPHPASTPTRPGMPPAPAFMSPVRHRLNSYLHSGARATMLRHQLPSSKQQEKAVDEHFSRSLHSLMTTGRSPRVDTGYFQKEAEFSKPPPSPESSGSDVEIVAVDGPKLSVIHSHLPNFLPRKNRLLESVGEQREIDASGRQDRHVTDSPQTVNTGKLINYQHRAGQKPQERPNWIKNNIHEMITNGLKYQDNTYHQESDPKILGNVAYGKIQDEFRENRTAEFKPPKNLPVEECTVKDKLNSMICTHIEDSSTGSQCSRQVTEISNYDMPHSGNTELLDGSSSSPETQVTTIASSNNSVVSNGLSGGMVNSLPRGVRYHPRPLIPDFSREDWIRMIQQQDKQIPVANVNPIIQDYTQQAESECLFYGKLSAAEMLGCSDLGGIPLDSKPETTLPIDICNADNPVGMYDGINGGTSFQGTNKFIRDTGHSCRHECLSNNMKEIDKIPAASSADKLTNCTSQIAASSFSDHGNQVNEACTPVSSQVDNLKVEPKPEISSESPLNKQTSESALITQTSEKPLITHISTARELSAQEANSSIPKANNDVNLALHFVTPKGRLKSRHARSEFVSAITPITDQEIKQQPIKHKQPRGSSEPPTSPKTCSTIKNELNDDFTVAQTVTKCDGDGGQNKKETQRYSSCSFERKHSDEYFTKKSKLLNSRTNTPTLDQPKITTPMLDQPKISTPSLDQSKITEVLNSRTNTPTLDQPKIAEVLNTSADTHESQTVVEDAEEDREHNSNESEIKEEKKKGRGVDDNQQPNKRRFQKKERKCMTLRERPQREAVRRKRALRRTRRFSSYHKNLAYEEELRKDEARRQRRILLRSEQYTHPTSTLMSQPECRDEPHRRHGRMLLRTTRHLPKTERTKSVSEKRLRTDVLRKSKTRKDPHLVMPANHLLIQSSSSQNPENPQPVVFKRKRRRRKVKDLFPVKRKKTKPAKKKKVPTATLH